MLPAKKASQRCYSRSSLPVEPSFKTACASSASSGKRTAKVEASRSQWILHSELGQHLGEPSPADGVERSKERKGANMAANDLTPFLRELSKSDRLDDVHRRVVLCRLPLALIQREQNPLLWAALQPRKATRSWGNNVRLPFGKW